MAREVMWMRLEKSHRGFNLVTIGLGQIEVIYSSLYFLMMRSLIRSMMNL
jgi:hypothetical protein